MSVSEYLLCVATHSRNVPWSTMPAGGGAGHGVVELAGEWPVVVPQLVILFFRESMVHVLCRRENWLEKRMQKPTKFPELATLRLRLTSRDISRMVSTRAGKDFCEL